MKGSEKDIYMSLLELAKNQGLKGVTFGEAIEHFRKEGFLTGEEYTRLISEDPDPGRLLKRIHKLVVDTLREITTERGQAYMMTSELRLRLLDHEELVFARKNAREARWLSMVAIGIALATLLFSFWQGGKPIKIDDNQLRQLTRQETVIESARG